jgi:hypothetical protein
MTNKVFTRGPGLARSGPNDGNFPARADGEENFATAGARMKALR